jgi:hypothetical protein
MTASAPSTARSTLLGLVRSAAIAEVAAGDAQPRASF